MSEPDYQDPDDFDADEQQQREDHNLRALRKKAKERDQFADRLTEAERDRDAARRESALLRAKIDLDTPMGKLFAKAYDGEPTTEAIRTAAAEYGLIEPEVHPEDEQARDQALGRLASSTQGSAPVGGGEKWDASTFAAWDPATQRRFMTQHRAQFEAFKRGEKIAPIPGFG